MKKWILYIAAALIIIGCGIGGIAMQTLNWDIKQATFEKGNIKQWQIDTKETERISVDVTCFEVQLQASPDESIHVIAYINKEAEVSVKQQEHALNVSAKINPMQLFSFRMFRWKNNGIVIQIPNGYAGDIALENENGSVTVSELQLPGNLSLSNSNGRIAVEKITALSLVAVNSNGSIHLEQVTVQEEVKTKNSNGSIKIEDVHAKMADSRNSNGRITLEEVTASESLQAQNSNGAIRIEDVFAPSVSLRNSNGSIKGNIEGRQSDWRIISNIKNGSSNLNNKANVDRPYLLEAENSNGSIRIEFSGR